MFKLSGRMAALVIGLSLVGASTASATDTPGITAFDGAREERQPRIGDSHDANACTTHAKLLRRACLADLKDDYLVHLADCVYVTAEDDERD